VAGTVSKLVARGRSVQWLALYESAKFIYTHGTLGRLVRKSKGRRANLTEGERSELVSLVKKAATG
jgi:hypothetical protein